MDIGALDFWTKIGVALLCGGLIGLERQLRAKPAGVRTSILICLGTTIFIALSIDQSDVAYSDRTRVLGQVVTGIGFLGAGVILIREESVLGITSAAVIWVLAAIGSLIGFEEYLEAVALSLVTVAALVGIGLLEGKYTAVLGKGIYSPRPLKASDEVPPKRGRLQDFINLAQEGEPVYVEVELVKRTATREIRNDKSDHMNVVAGNYLLVAKYEFRFQDDLNIVSKVYAQGELNEPPEEATANLEIANARLEVDYQRLKAAGIVVEEKHFI